MSRRSVFVLSAAVFLVTPSAPLAPRPDDRPRLDLDVGIPPGSPVTWGKRFPAITPRKGPLFPVTGSANTAGKKDKPGAKSDNRTVVRPATVKMDVNISTSFGVVRILTWDLAGHLLWVTRTPRSIRGPVTGPSGKSIQLPYVSDGLYWANMASLLRLMLHPQLVSEKELIAHLVEIGDPLLAVLDNSVAEKALVPPSKTIRKMVDTPTGHAAPLPGKSPRETMLKRFLAEQLSRAYPYDPEGGFGQRFFMFSEEVEPYLIEYAEKHPGAFVQRNAVSAVGRYRTKAAMAALARLAGTTKDPVVLMRSLAAVGAYRSLADRAPILERLRKGKDPIERVALIAAVGRMGMLEAVADLLKIGGKARDPDLLQAVVTALVRIPHAPEHPAVTKFAKRIETLARMRPERYRVKSRGGPAADIPDGAKTRGEVIHQLALLLQVHLGGKTKAKAGPSVLAYVTGGGAPGAGRRGAARRPAGRRPGAGPAGRAMPRRSRGFSNDSMRRVHPPVQLLFLETLRKLGPEGQAGLERVARDTSAEPALRGHALSQLPWSSRGAIAAEILERKTASVEAKIYAIEVLANDGHDRLEEIGRKLLEEAVEAAEKKVTASPELRYLWLQALRALGRRSLLKTADLLPLIPHAEARRAGSETVKQRVRNLVEALVNEAAAGLASKARIARIDEIVDLVVAAGLNDRLATADRKETRAHLLARLVSLKGHRADVRFKNILTQELVTYLTGFKMRLDLRSRTEFRPVVMFEEELLLILGRTRDKEAAKALIEFLDKQIASPLRAHAALALGMVQDLTHARHLVPLLKDPDGFTRFCAYESLRRLTGRDYFADWMFGDPATRNLTAGQYEKLVGK